MNTPPDKDWVNREIPPISPDMAPAALDAAETFILKAERKIKLCLDDPDIAPAM